MTANTTVGPTGPEESFSAKKPDNHTPDQSGGGFSQGTGADSSDVTLTGSGELKPVNP